MIMRNSKIKALFEKAEEQIQVDEIRKQETYNMMLETMEKQRTPMMSIKNILLHQIWYMDKVFLLFMVLLFAWKLFLLQHYNTLG